MTYPRTATARLLDRDGTVMAGSSLANAFGIRSYDERNDVGYGQMTLSLSEAASADLLPGRYIDVLVEGTPRFTFKIEGNPEYAVIQRGEEHDQVITVKGPGWACVLDEAMTYPEVGLTVPLDASWRIFSFASSSFPNAGGWANAVEIYEYLDGVTVSPGRGRWQQAPDLQLYPAPIGWPWDLSPNNGAPNLPAGTGVGFEPTYWIWSQAGHSTEEYGIGWCFFRKQMTLADRAIVVFNTTADNFFTVFVEGVPCTGETDDHYVWMGWKDFNVDLVADTYQLAAVVENISVGLPGEGVNQNPGGFLFSCFTQDGNNTPIDMFVVSDDSWQCLFVPVDDPWPGWTPHQIINKLLVEAAARTGGINVFSSITSTDANDSDGNPWRPMDPLFDSPYVPSFAVEVGSSTLLDALKQLHDEGWVDWHVRPGTLIIDMWRARAATPSSSATLAHGVNLVALERNATAPYANALLIQWTGGYYEIENPTAITAYGTRVEALYASDATSEADAKRIGWTELEKRVQAAFPSIVAVVEPTGAGDCPYEAYDVNDFVTVPAVGGGTEIVRVLSIGMEQDALGYAIWTLELNAKLDVLERRQNDLMRQIGGRNQILKGRVN